ncbi:hypothetical protein BJF89_07680 [Corynebacterium sp. CNJ-954]|jgi:hypothetical protein|uniref:DUF3556 domain-containing protein n=1 Tax=Corynebacterium sp. CNJ-954 TaxID=1904962 RepID=UPI0009654381|nr:DUF3556 domain-containing protein [Corynebacterium sp. CNJ-954]OLT51022.1 hypothetical protein BJF89_07680 [Corynebacterium sp. CNJ-954]
MGLLTPDLPPGDPAAVGTMPFRDRMKVMCHHWGEYGFGVPKVILMFYIVKMAAYVGLGILIVGLTTPDLGGFSNFAAWWNEPVVYLKLMVWTILFEIVGLSASSGPMSFNINPPFGGCLYWARPKTLRLPPWPGKVPFTSGDSRSWFDVALYLLIIANLVFLLVHPGERHDLVPNAEAGLLPSWALLTYLVMICVLGLRDKIVFLAARCDQYPLILLAFAVLTSFTDMILAAKIVIVVVWVGAGFSKLGHHFSPTVSAMTANTPWIPSKALKRAMYRKYPDDMRPSTLTHLIAHVPGTVLEIGAPLVLLFSTNRTVTLIALIGILAFHAYIISTIPLAVPLEWNIFFMFAAVFLFWGYDAGAGYGVTDFSSPWVGIVVAACVLIWPVLGNLRPDWISFLVSYRQYSGNWATSTWAWKDKAAEDKLEEDIVKSGEQHSRQINDYFGEDIGEVFTQKAVAFRAMHSSGRAIYSILDNYVDMDTYRIREGETVVSGLIGWNFGDGHLHDDQLVDAVQKRCNYAPGEMVVVYTESQPVNRNYIEYRVMDAAFGIVERGTYKVVDSTSEQPWLPNGQIPHTVTWRMPGYDFPGVRPAADVPAAEQETETARTRSGNETLQP